MDHFELVSEFQPTGDQPEAIDSLVKGFEQGKKQQLCLFGIGYRFQNVVDALRVHRSLKWRVRQNHGHLFG